MSSIEVVKEKSKKNKQKVEQQQSVSNEITNGCDFKDNKTINSQILSYKNVPETNIKDCQVDVCIEPLLIQDCVDVSNQANETNEVFSDVIENPISVCDIILTKSDICKTVIIDDNEENSALIYSGRDSMKNNFKLLNLNEKPESLNQSKNKKFLESDDQIMNQIFFQTIAITPTTDEDILINSKPLNDNSASFKETKSDLNIEPVNFFSSKFEEDETFNHNYVDSVEMERENLCSLSFSSIDYNTANIQLIQENQADYRSPENEMLQPETLYCKNADQMLKQRPSILIDCYDSDSKTEEENVVSAEKKVNDYCFYFDQTIEEDDDGVSFNIDNTVSTNKIDKNQTVDERAKVQEKVDLKDTCFQIEEDESEIDVDSEGVLNESCSSLNSPAENIDSESTAVKKTVKKSVKTTKTTSKKSSKIISVTESSAVIISSENENFDNHFKKMYKDNKNDADDINEQQLQNLAINSLSTKNELSEQIIQKRNIDEIQQQMVEIDTNDIEKRKSIKKKTKKKKSDSEKENISVKSSFSKFDALQKKNLQSLQNERGGENGLSPDGEKKCHACEKVVFQMEQIKAEKKFWHRACFRCVECSKQLNVDTYQSHEGILYCKPHFKILFLPKMVEDNNEPVKIKKHEMIILENQPIELPPDVIRSSDKTDLGLEELHQINLRQRFQLFENAGQQESKVELDKGNNVKRSTSILSKLARFQAKGMDVGVVDDSLNGISYENSSTEDEDELDDENHEDIELIRAKRAQKEKPISFKEMYDIKFKFESGQLMSKEERREERKQELQNIRSRLFLGKQAKIKEMYQQAVAESELTITSSSKKSDVEIGDKAKSIKEKFEKGEIYDETDMKKSLKEEEMAVFEKGISKQSRSLFLELDATASKSPNQESSPSANLKSITRQTPRQNSQSTVAEEDIVRSDQKADDVRIETADILSKFKFFEAYQPPEKEKKSFRITPPRDYQGLTKLSSPEKEDYRDLEIARNDKRSTDQDEILEFQKTTSKVLSMFRQMEENKEEKSYGPKPLKRFTPPPESERDKYVTNDDSGPDYSDEDEEYSEEESEEESNCIKSSQKDLDEFLKTEQSVERAKKLREKFEKWEENEIKKEMNNSSVNLFDEAQDEGQMETAKSLRARFEQMQNDEPKLPPIRPKVNRFV